MDDRQWRRIRDRTDVKVCHLFGREEHEAAAACDDTREVVVPIMMDLRSDTAAEPQERPDTRKQGHRILLNKVRQMAGERQHLDGDDRRIRAINLAFDAIECLADTALTLGEGEFPQIRAVAESSPSAGGRLYHGGGDAAVHALEVIVERRR